MIRNVRNEEFLFHKRSQLFYKISRDECYMISGMKVAIFGSIGVLIQ